MHTRLPNPPVIPFGGLLLVAAVLGACAPDPATAPTPARASAPALNGAPDDQSTGEAHYVAAVRRRLERAADGLLYTSESDYPFTFYHAPARTSAPLTVAAFRDAAGVPADSLVEEVSLDEFFARHIERVDPNDPAAVALVPRYEALKRELRATVRQPRVFRVGRIAVRCYAVGVDAFGNVTGLETMAIET
jgi:hypothetical protein